MKWKMECWLTTVYYWENLSAIWIKCCNGSHEKLSEAMQESAGKLVWIISSLVCIISSEYSQSVLKNELARERCR